MRRIRGRMADADGIILRLLDRHRALTAADLGDMLRREYGLDFTPSELGKRIRCSARLRAAIARESRCYWEPRGQFPRTDSVYTLRCQ